jgi:hypothetical protein
MRNPERLKLFLAVLYQFDGLILDDSLIDKICINIIKARLYKPTIISDYLKLAWKEGRELSDAEATKAFEDNPQDHKEAGFDHGWPSRFDTWFKISKELGFVWYWPGEKIAFSDSGKLLIDQDNPQNETLVFANAFAKYNRNNPFRGVLNTNTPLILLLETIKHLNDDPDYKGAGISKSELPILLCWRDDDSIGLYKYIKSIRTKYGFTPSDEVVIEACRMLLDATKRSDNTLLTDYPDDFIRKMRLTGLISIRGGGRFVDINKKEQNAVDYVLEAYHSIDYSHQRNEKVFFEYIGQVDSILAEKLGLKKPSEQDSVTELQKWSEYYGWNAISLELLILSNKRKSADPILMLIDQPLRLEFLTALAIFKQLPNVTVNPNYISDDEGLPTSFAGGGMPDIECIENGHGVLIEATLLKGAQQHIRESFSVKRHLEEYLIKDDKAYSILLSPQTYIDTARHAAFSKAADNTDVRTLGIPRFVELLSLQTSLSELSEVL